MSYASSSSFSWRSGPAVVVLNMIPLRPVACQPDRARSDTHHLIKHGLFSSQLTMHDYQLVAATSDEATVQTKSGQASARCCRSSEDPRRRLWERVFFALNLFAAALCGFGAGAVSFSRGAIRAPDERETLAAAAPRIPLPRLYSVFTYDSEFSREPPAGAGSGQQAEPVWDSLIPSMWTHSYVPEPTQFFAPNMQGILTQGCVAKMALATSKTRISHPKRQYRRFSISSTVCTPCAAHITPKEMSLRLSISARSARLTLPIASTTCSRA